MVDLYNFLTKRGQVISFGLGLLLVALTYILLSQEASTFESADVTQIGWNVFFGLVASGALIVLCAVLAILFGVVGMAMNPKGSMVAIIGIAALVIIFLIFYFTFDPASSNAISETIEEFNITEGQSRFISSSIWTTITLIGLAGLAFLLSEVVNLFK